MGINLKSDTPIHTYITNHVFSNQLKYALVAAAVCTKLVLWNLNYFHFHTFGSQPSQSWFCLNEVTLESLWYWFIISQFPSLSILSTFFISQFVCVWKGNVGKLQIPIYFIYFSIPFFINNNLTIFIDLNPMCSDFYKWI